MKQVNHYSFKLLLLLLLLSSGPLINGAVIRIVAVTYDSQTMLPIPGKQVAIHVQQLAPALSLYQQNLTATGSGEIILPALTIPDSAFFSYHFSLSDCQNNTIHFSDTLQALQNDTLFLFLGVCHGYLPGTCQALFSYNPDTSNALIYHFFDASSGNPGNHLWNFGDGTTSTAKNPVKQYNSPGVYFVCLTISDSSGPCMSTWCTVLSITQGITINATFFPILDSFSVTPRKVLLFNETYANVPLNQYLWSFGDGIYTNSKTPVHQYKQSGTYQICLTAGQAGGLSDTACQWITIPDYFNLWGQLFEQSMTASGGEVHLIKPLSSATGYPLLDRSSADANGLYYFAQRITHNYLLRAIPEAAGPASTALLPTYSGNTIFWKDAALVSLNTDISNYDIRFQKLKQTGNGIGQISGQVASALGTIPQHTMVLLLDAADRQPVAFTWADSINGSFNLGFLPLGQYVIVVEVPGLTSSEEVITLTSQSSSFTGVQIWLSLFSSVASPTVENDVITLFPNPVINQINLNIPSSNWVTGWIIVNSKGERVMQGSVPGTIENQYTISTEMLPAGVYTMVVYTEKQHHQVPFVKVK